MDIAIRFDDPGPRSNRALEAQILEIMKAHSLPLTAAVIPFHQENEAIFALERDTLSCWVEACENGLTEIAQHGYAHIQRNQDMDAPPSEFDGQSQETQLDWIESGRECLQHIFGRPIEGFVPPWGTWDASTARILGKLGFTYLSGASESPRPTRLPLNYLPRTCTIAQLQEAVLEARRYSYFRPIVIAVLHHYDFAESGGDEAVINLREFASIVSWLARQPDLTVVTLSEMARRVPARGLHLGRLLLCLRLRSRLPWRIRAVIPRRGLLSRFLPFA